MNICRKARFTSRLDRSGLMFLMSAEYIWVLETVTLTEMVKNVNWRKWNLTLTLNNRKLSYFGIWIVGYECGKLWIDSAQFWECRQLANRPRKDSRRAMVGTRPMNFAIEGKANKRTHSHKRPWHSLIFWLNIADTLNQITDRLLVFFCVINCQHKFDCWFFLFTFIKLSLNNQSYFIGKAKLIPFRKVVTRKHSMAYWLKEKGNILLQ